MNRGRTLPVDRSSPLFYGFRLRTCSHALPSHCFAAGDRVVVEITGQKLKGVLVLHVSFMYQKWSTPSWTTSTHPWIAALEKWRISTQQAACDKFYRKLTQQNDVPLEGLVNDSFIQLLRRKIIPYPSTTTLNNTVRFPPWWAPLLKYLTTTNRNHWIS